jgi:predicted transcriptional regulator YdeE
MPLNAAMLLLFFLALSQRAFPLENNASVPPVHKSGCFYVAGYSIRTNNANEMSGRGGIGKLWQRFLQQNLRTTIPHRVDHNLIVVYSDYAADEKGEFSYLLGTRVSSVHDLPAELSFRKVVPGEYAVFTTRVGPTGEVLRDEWNRIWRCPAVTMGGRRAFITDYEVYDRRSADPMGARVEIHIGLQSAGCHRGGARRHRSPLSALELLWYRLPSSRRRSTLCFN